MKKIIVVLMTLFVAVDSMRANVPDSVYIVAYNANPSQGLVFAQSADGSHWTSICEEASFVGSDYGPWESGKKMYRPVLTRLKNGLWHLEFQLGRYNQYARTTSSDLIHWKPQDYPFLKSSEAVDQRFDELDKKMFQTVVVGGVEHRGCVHRVAYAQVEMMENAGLAAAMRTLTLSTLTMSTSTPPLTTRCSGCADRARATPICLPALPSRQTTRNPYRPMSSVA